MAIKHFDHLAGICFFSGIPDETATHFRMAITVCLICLQCLGWPQKSSGYFPNFMTFTTKMITISYTFQYKIVLTIFKFSGHLSKKIRQWPMAWREKEHCVLVNSYLKNTTSSIMK